MPTKIIASLFALTAFAAAILGGIAAENPALTTLGRAVVAMFACGAVGLAVGALAQRAILEDVQRYKRENPIEPLAETNNAPAPDAPAARQAASPPGIAA